MVAASFSSECCVHRNGGFRTWLAIDPDFLERVTAVRCRPGGARIRGPACGRGSRCHDQRPSRFIEHQAAGRESPNGSFLPDKPIVLDLSESLDSRQALRFLQDLDDACAAADVRWAVIVGDAVSTAVLAANGVQVPVVSSVAQALHDFDDEILDRRRFLLPLPLRPPDGRRFSTLGAVVRLRVVVSAVVITVYPVSLRRRVR